LLKVLYTERREKIEGLVGGVWGGVGVRGQGSDRSGGWRRRLEEVEEEEEGGGGGGTRLKRCCCCLPV